MKKSILSVIISLLFISGFNEIQAQNSKLILKIWDDSYFSIKLDNQVYHNQVNKFKIDNLRPGNHRIVIFQRFGIHNDRRIVYKGYVQIPKASKVYAKISRHNELVIKKIEPIVNNSYSYNHYNEGNNYGNNYHNNSNNNYYQKPLLNLPKLKHTIANASFESDKLMIANQAISNNTVRSGQVYQIMLTLSFESSRLKFAKLAYENCVDKANYFKVNNALTFSSSIRELNNFINSQKINMNQNHGNSNLNNNHSNYNNSYYNTGGDW